MQGYRRILTFMLALVWAVRFSESSFTLPRRHTHQEYGMLSALRLCCRGQCKEWSPREGSGEVWGQRPAWIVSLSLSFAFLFVLSPPTTKAKHLTLSKTNAPYLLNSQCISCLVLPILVSGALKPRSQELTPTFCLPSLGTAIWSLKLQNAPSVHPRAQCFVLFLILLTLLNST